MVRELPPRLFLALSLAIAIYVAVALTFHRWGDIRTSCRVASEIAVDVPARSTAPCQPRRRSTSASPVAWVSDDQRRKGWSRVCAGERRGVPRRERAPGVPSIPWMLIAPSMTAVGLLLGWRGRAFS